MTMSVERICDALGGIKPPGIRHLHRTSIAGDAPF
jgi:hypothetical protein